MYEFKLRDLIAENIEVLEKGLVLIQKEQYIPNNLATKGFIDLLAKDADGKYVLIELKRSKEATREALHEVNKYVEGVKHYFGAKDNEIRVIVASTNWSELLLPFSRFVDDTTISIKGFQISISSESDISVSNIIPLKIVNGRFIAPWHDMCWYYEEKALTEGILSIEQSCAKKEIEDYVILLVKLKQSTIDEMEQQVNDNLKNMCSDLPPYKQHGYIAYFAMQMLSKDQCLYILKNAHEDLGEIQETILDMDDEDALCYLHESVMMIKPMFKSDYYEIGYDAKISQCLNDFEYAPITIKKYGKFARNINLSDEIIIAELRGEDGNTHRRLKETIDLNNKSEVQSLCTNVRKSLEDNSTWKQHILNIVEDLQINFPKTKIEISIFNPSSGIFTIYYTVTKEKGILYIPSYSIIVYNPEPIRMYFGSLEDNGMALELYEIMKKYYDNQLSALLLSATWGGKDNRDLDIVEDLGCTYCSYYCDISEDDRTFYKLKDYRWRKCEETINPIELYSDYLNKKEKLVRQILCKLLPRDNGFMWQSSNSNLYFDEIIKDKQLEISDCYYINPPEKCDLCNFLLAKEKYMVDGIIKETTQCANMCPDCAMDFGEGIGLGKGQLYQNTEKGWLLVSGDK